MPSKHRPTNAKLGLTRPPTAFALFCQHMKETAIPATRRRRITGKTAVNGREYTLMKWNYMSQASRDVYVQKVNMIAKRNAEWRKAACNRQKEEAADTADPSLQIPRFLCQGAPVAVDASCIGSGTYGAVYRGQTATGMYAIKVAKKCLQNLTSEFEVLRGLGSHPSIVPCYALLEGGGLVLGLADGTLAMLISSWPFPREASSTDLLSRLRLSLQLALGVEFLHQKKLLHADLKPDNILVRGDFQSLNSLGNLQLWIADFGLSRGFGKGQTSPANLVCTKQYRAIELLYHGKGIVVLKPSMDVWACGCIYFELFSEGGRRLFEAVPCIHDFPLPVLSQRCNDLVSHRCKAFSVESCVSKCITLCTAPVETRINIQAVVRKWLEHPVLAR